MSNKILVALDGSDGSNRAVDFATEYAKASGSDIVLAYIIEWSPYSFHTPEELERRHQRRESEIERAKDSIVRTVARALKDTGINVQSEVRHGNIADTLTELAQEYDVSQVFVGKRGESRARSVLFGSVTMTLIQESPVAVTVVP